MSQHWNKGDLLKEVETRTGFRIAPITLWTWEKKGLFTPSGYMMNGKQKRPVYNEKDLNKLIKKVEEARARGSSRLKL